MPYLFEWTNHHQKPDQEIMKWGFRYISLIGLLLPSFLWAQTTHDTVQLNTVEITAKRPIEEAAISKTEVDTLVLQTLNSKTLASLMTANTPVFIKSYGRGSSATASFRGTAATHTHVNWNGMNLNSPMRGDVDFSLFPVYFIDRINLLHGGSSLSAGSGALGGSILIENKPDWRNTISVKYIQHIESFNTFKEFGQIGLGGENFQSKTRIYLDQSENDFPFYNYAILPNRDDVQKNADYKKYGFLQEFYGRIKQKHLLSLKVWGIHSYRNLPQLMSFEGENRVEFQEDDQIKAIGQWKYYRNNGSWMVSSGYSYNELHYFRSSTEAEFENFNSTSHEKSSFNHIEYQYKNEEHIHLKTSFDGNYHQVEIFDSTSKTGYKESRVELSFLAQANWQINEKLAAYFLFRSEYYDETFVPAIPSIGVEYTLNRNKNWKLHLNATRNYHKPNLNDLYWIPGGNPDLLPEDGYTGELGAKFSKKNRRWNLDSKINIYASLIENWIVWHPSSSGAFYWEADNLKKVFARGIEWNINYSLEFVKNWKLKTIANYAYTATTNQNAVESVDESRGKQLIYIPKHNANIILGLNHKKWELNIDNSVIGKRYTTSSNEESDFELILSAYTLTNLSLEKSFNWKKWESKISFRIENIFDTDYMSVLWRPMPGRYYAINLQIGLRK